MDDIFIREGGPDDYAPALAVQRRAYRQKEAPLYGPDIPPLADTPATLTDEIAAGARLLVAMDGDRLVASLRMKRLPDGAVFFYRLSVDPDAQGRGLGQRMVRAVEAFHPDAPAFRLDCGEKSEENRYIYTKLGYRETGERHQMPGGPIVFTMEKISTHVSNQVDDS